MRAAIYNPYLDTLGGGERYTMAVATALSSFGYSVYVEWKNSSIKQRLEARFGINLKKINFISSINKGEGYDVCFWLSDGSIPLLRARVNLLHFQFPFTQVNGKSLLNRMKLFRYRNVVCNSIFTKQVIDEEYGVESVVLYPPVDVLSIKPGIKKDIILSVSRFSQLTQAKNQDVLVEVFKNMCDKGVRGWQLALAGGTEVGADKYVAKLKKLVRGYPIKIIEKPTFTELKKLYATSKIFWLASGFGTDEVKEPTRVEHFGIVLVEAMAAGCVPVAYGAGGPTEIIDDGRDGFLWKKKSELKKITKKLIENQTDLQKLKTNSVEKAKRFSYEEFNKNLKNIIS